MKIKGSHLVIGSVVLVIGLIVWAGVTSDSRGIQGSPIGGSASGSTTTSGLAPDFTLTTLEGETISLADYRGEKAVVLDFWASWCPNCRRDMPKLSKLYEKYKDQVEVIGVNLRESSSTVQEYIDKARISFPIVLDPNGVISRDYAIQYTNTHILIDLEGNIVQYIPGDIRESHITSLL